MNEKILLVEDDLSFGSIMKSYLELNEFEVTWKTNGKQAWSEFFKAPYALCIVDVMMPEMDGFSLAREIRSSGSQTPLIFLTAKALKEDMVQGFRAGADDYITKPFDSEILLLKIRAILNRSGERDKHKAEEKDEFLLGSYTFNYSYRKLSRDGKTQSLSPKEAELLKLLCLANENVLSKKEALMKIWGDDSYFTTRSMDVFMTRLRKYLKDDPSVEIVSVPGNGYRLLERKGGKPA